MKVLIIGGNSSTGRALKPVLERFAEVETAGRSGCDQHFDLADPASSLNLQQGTDVVINTVAAFPGPSASDYELAIRTNVLGVARLCRLCEDAGIAQFVHISSLSATLDPSSPYYTSYAISKRQADEWLQFHGARGFPVTILRPSQLYGIGRGNRLHQPLLSHIIDRVSRGEDVQIYGGNDALRNYLHLEDFANIIGGTILQKTLGTYSCTHPADIRYSEIFEAARAVFATGSKLEFLRDRPDIPDNVFEREDALYRLVGYSPQITVAMAMKMEAAYLQEAAN